MPPNLYRLEIQSVMLVFSTPSCELLHLYLLSDLPHPSPRSKRSVQYTDNRVGIGLSYRPASLCSFFGYSIPDSVPGIDSRLIAGLKFPTKCVAVGGWGLGGGVLSCVVDHILQEFNTLFLTRFKNLKKLLHHPK